MGNGNDGSHGGEGLFVGNEARREHTDRKQKSFRNAAAGFSRLSATRQRKYPVVNEKSKQPGK
jgi:hypothetical protein